MTKAKTPAKAPPEFRMEIAAHRAELIHNMEGEIRAIMLLQENVLRFCKDALTDTEKRKRLWWIELRKEKELDVNQAFQLDVNIVTIVPEKPKSD